jgi:hypothetical protein
MDIPELMQRLAEADERRRDAEAGSLQHFEARVDVERLAAAITEASRGRLVISTGVPVFGSHVTAAHDLPS